MYEDMISEILKQVIRNVHSDDASVGKLHSETGRQREEGQTQGEERDVYFVQN